MKKFLSIALALLMVCVMLPVVALAEGTTLPEADATTGEITLTENVTLSGDVTLDGKTINTAGYTITIAGNATISNCTFKNAVDGDTANKASHTVLYVSVGATLNMTGCMIESASYQPLYVAGTCTLASTDIKCTVANNKYDAYSMVIVDGTSATLNMKSGSITMVESTVMSDGMYGVYACNGGSVNIGDAATHTGPTITSHCAALGMNNTTAPAVWNIYGGTFTSKMRADNNEWWKYFAAVLYAPGQGTVNIFGGSFTGGNYAVSMPWSDAGAALNISGGTFANTSTDENDGLFYYREKSSNNNTGTPEVKISGGNFNDTLVAGDVENKKMTVSGGTFADQENAKKYIENDKLVVNPATGKVESKTITIIVPGDTTPAETPKTEDQKNPSTGANDVVAAAVALMAVSALGAAVLTRKK